MTSNEDNKCVVNQLESKIIEQIEFYFSDINLSRDKIMQRMLTYDNGWVRLDTLMTFRRLRFLSKDKSVIINALKKSDSNLLEISECLNKIRRLKDRPLPEFDEKYTQNINDRTVHIKGFPKDTKLNDALMDFCRQFGAVESFEMRNDFNTNTFNGCISVTYFNKEDAQKAVDISELKYKVNTLFVEYK